MRKVLFGLAGLLIATVGLGQGTVKFSNLATDLSSPPDRLVRYAPGVTNPFGTNGAPLVGPTLRAQLYYGSSTDTEGSLVSVTESPQVFRGSTTAQPGTWLLGANASRVINGYTNGQVVNLQVRVYDSALATSYEAASAAGQGYFGLLGKSVVFTNLLAGDPQPPSDYVMKAFTGFNVTSPSTEGPAFIATNPVSVVKLVGETATFTVTAAGAPTLTYQWSKNGSNLGGQTTSSLTVNNVQLADNGGSYQVVVVNGQGSATSTVATLTVNCPAITVTPATLPNGTFGSAYSQSVGASGGAGPYTFAVTSGSLPGGVSLSVGGLLSGTPTATGPFNFTITATDSTGCSGSTSYTLTIDCSVITVTPTTLPDPGAGAAYSQTVSGNGGGAPYTFSLDTNAPYGPLPAGLSLTESNGVVSGTATTLGSYIFNVIATDTNGCFGSQAYTVTVGCATITLNPSTLPGTTNGGTYGQTVSASGGIAPYVFTNTSGSLPTGLSLDNTSGAITGTATAPGTFSFTITATDANGCTGSRAYSILVGNPDGIQPVVSIVSPKTKSEFTVNMITVAGKASDLSGIADVSVRANGGAYGSAVLTGLSTKPVWTNNAVTLATGTNVIEVQATDNSTMVTGPTTIPVLSKSILVFLKVTNTLHIVQPGNGSGTIVGVPVITASGTETPADGATLSIGRNYTLQVIPDALNGSLLSNVVSVIDGVTTIYDAAPDKEAQKGNKKYVFKMGTNTTLYVNFVTNRFVGAGGFYYGLFSETATAHESAGWFQIKTDSKLKFSGKLLLHGEVVPFAGTFDLAGNGVTKAGKIVSLKNVTNNPLTMTLQLDLNGAGTISGTISNLVWGSVAQLSGDKLVWDKLTNNPPAVITNKFTMVMVGSTNATLEPAGDGYLLGGVGPDGKMKAKGYAGDGVKLVTTVTGVSTNGDWPFYASLYQYYRTMTNPVVPANPNTKTYLGSIMGWLNVSNGILTGDLVWTKSSWTNLVGHSGGFTNLHSDTDGSLLSSQFTPVPVGTRVIALPSGTVTIQDGNLLSPIVDTFTYSAGPLPVAKIVAAGVLTNGIKIAIKPTGELSGTFDPVLKTKVFGAVLQNQATARGVFVGSTQSGSIRLTP